MREGNEKVTTRKSLGKQPAVIKWLTEKYNGSEVPEPSFAPRKKLRAEAIKEVAFLGGQLDEETMKKAIDAYNDLVRGDPK